jgi:hypothetical protein
MAMSTTSLNVAKNGEGGSTEASALEPAVTLAQELSRRIAELPSGAPEARHPNYGVARALALTVVDMLEGIARDMASRAARSPARARRG